MIRWLALVAFLVGCGGSGPSEPTQYGARVLGNWLLDKGTSGAGVNFTAGDQYSVVVLAATADPSTFDVQLETGTYGATASVITFAPALSTCPGAHPAYGEAYTVSASSLTLSDPSGALVFVRNDSPASSAAATYGCFNNGAFTASPLAPVR